MGLQLSHCREVVSESTGMKAGGKACNVTQYKCTIEGDFKHCGMDRKCGRPLIRGQPHRTTSPYGSVATGLCAVSKRICRLPLFCCCCERYPVLNSR